MTATPPDNTPEDADAKLIALQPVALRPGIPSLHTSSAASVPPAAAPEQSLPSVQLHNHGQDVRALDTGSEVFQQQVTTHNSIQIQVDASGLGLQAQQGGYQTAADGTAQALPHQQIEGHIPAAVLAGQAALPDSQSAQAQTVNLKILDPRPITARLSAEGELQQVNLPAGTPGTFQAVLAQSASGKPLYVPYDARQPMERGQPAVLVQVNQGVQVTQNVKVSKSIYSNENFKGYFAPDDPDFTARYLNYLVSKDVLLDPLRPTRMTRALLVDTTQSLRRTGDALAGTLGMAKGIVQQTVALARQKPVEDTFEAWRARMIHAGESEEEFESRMFAAPYFAWVHMVICAAVMAFGAWQLSLARQPIIQFAIGTGMFMVLLHTLVQMWRAHQASYRTFRSFKDWITRPAWWISFPMTDEQARQALEQEQTALRAQGD